MRRLYVPENSENPFERRSVRQIGYISTLLCVRIHILHKALTLRVQDTKHNNNYNNYNNKIKMYKSNRIQCLGNSNKELHLQVNIHSWSKKMKCRRWREGASISSKWRWWWRRRNHSLFWSGSGLYSAYCCDRSVSASGDSARAHTVWKNRETFYSRTISLWNK